MVPSRGVSIKEDDVGMVALLTLLPLGKVDTVVIEGILCYPAILGSTDTKSAGICQLEVFFGTKGRIGETDQESRVNKYLLVLGVLACFVVRGICLLPFSLVRVNKKGRRRACQTKTGTSISSCVENKEKRKVSLTRRA